MARSMIRKLIVLPVAALALTAGTFATTAEFRASQPGDALSPVAGAGQIIQLLQANRAILWTSLDGGVATVVVEGWDGGDSGNELAGSMTLENVADGSAGVIDIGQRPRLVSFELDR
jgi:hypothetical protein